MALIYHLLNVGQLFYYLHCSKSLTNLVGNYSPLQILSDMDGTSVLKNDKMA